MAQESGLSIRERLRNREKATCKAMTLHDQNWSRTITVRAEALRQYHGDPPGHLIQWFDPVENVVVITLPDPGVAYQSKWSGV